MSRRLDIGSLFRSHIPGLVPYSSARDEYSGSAHVFLDANENPFNQPLNRYPDPAQHDLKQVLSGMKHQQQENLFLGNGSDEGIDLLIRVFCNPGVDNLVTVDPTYGMYGVSASIHDVKRKQVLLRPDFTLDPDAVLNATDRNTKLIFLCSPNNPTSNAFNRAAMEQVIDHASCMVVVDEAYIDFSREEGMLSDVPEKRNLVVLQTLSKAWGLAGIRLGMVFGDPELIQALSRVKYPYNVNSLTISTALDSLSDSRQYEAWVRLIVEERDRLSRELNALPLIRKVYPSDANFLLVQVDDPRGIYQSLMDRGIIVRDRSSVPLCEGCLRITVGTPDENRLLLEALSVINATNEKNQA